VPGTLPEFASRLTGSSDLYETSARRPVASINFATCHDGFTLADLVSYNSKHNEANGDGNTDGSNDNRSWNCGVEGPTDDPDVLALRGRQQRNFLATLLLSQGVPMLLAGDEFGRTQLGNNNGYCQDNELSWLHWPAELAAPAAGTDWPGTGRALPDFARTLLRFRAEHPAFRRRRFFAGPGGQGKDPHADDIAWLTPSGVPMTGDDWRAGFAKSVAVFLNGDAITEPGPRGEPITDDSFLLLFNAAEHGIDFTMPDAGYGEQWVTVLDTAEPSPDPEPEPAAAKPGDVLTLPDRSLRVLRRA
jgi:glycogen operon protein